MARKDLRSEKIFLKKRFEAVKRSVV